MSSLVHPSLYGPIFQWVLFVLVLIMAARCNANTIYNGSVAQSMSSIGKLLVLAITLIVGYRPISYYFGDMVVYAGGYSAREISGQADFFSTLSSFEGEYVFAALEDFCIQYADIHFMFFVCAICYFVAPCIACSRILGKYWFAPYTAMAAMIDYWGFAVNGVRNGAAAGLMILALSFKKRLSLSLPLAVLSIGIHKSMALAAAAGILAHFYKNTRMYICGWFGSIALSAVMGRSISAFMVAHLGGGDERMSRYLAYAQDKEMMSLQSSSGFRADFLLYSAVPIFVGYWYTEVKQVNDTVYRWWLNTYITANAFWVLMMWTANTNRFAVISWFIAGIVLMYPFFKCKFTANQGRYAACALLCWYVFCFYQNIIRGGLI